MAADPEIENAGANAIVELAHASPFRLGQVQVRPATREVIGPAGREVLEPRVMKVLVALARAEGEVLTRDDLIASCWDGLIVGDDAISRVISRLRRTSEGVGREGWTLETVTKVGYRLLPAGHDADAAAAWTPLPEPRAARPSRRLWLGAGAGVAVAAAGGGLAWRLTHPAPSRAARELYAKGREAMKSGLPQDTFQAQAFLREAVADSPKYAEAWGALALAYQGGLLFTEPARQQGVRGQAQAAAERALDLEPNEGQATAALALMAPVYQNWTAAEGLYQRALARHARDPQVALAYARMLLEVGRMKDAVVQAQAAVAGDPFAPWSRHILGLALWATGQIAEADLAVAKALERFPRHYALWFLQLDLLAFTGRADRAVAFGDDLANRPLTIGAPDIELHMAVPRALASRTPADARAAIDANAAAARRGVGYAENAMGALSTLGQVDEAFVIARALYFDEGFSLGERRFASGQFAVPTRRRLTHDLFMPPTRALRRDPRFATLVRDIGLADYWKTSRQTADPALFA